MNDKAKDTEEVAVAPLRRVAIVTGASRGIGAAIAQRLALGLFVGRELALARDARQLADAIHLFLCQGFFSSQFFRLCSGAGMRPPRAMKSAALQRLTGMTGA